MAPLSLIYNNLYDVQKFNNSSWGAQRTGLADAFFDNYQGSFLNIIPGTTNNSLSEKAFASVFGRISYDLDKKYFLTINYRRDGNSALGAGKKYGNFGGVSVGWTLSDEKFYKSLPFSDTVTSVKLRASWGKVGNGNLAKITVRYLFIIQHYMVLFQHSHLARAVMQI